MSLPPTDPTAPSLTLNVWGVPAGPNPGQSVEPVVVVGDDTAVFQLVQGTTLTAHATAEDVDGGLWFVSVSVSYVEACDSGGDLGQTTNQGYGDMTVATGFGGPSNWAPGNPVPPPHPAQAPAAISHSLKVELPKGCDARQGYIAARAVNSTGTETRTAKFNFVAG